MASSSGSSSNSKSSSAPALPVSGDASAGHESQVNRRPLSSPWVNAVRGESQSSSSVHPSPSSVSSLPDQTDSLSSRAPPAVASNDKAAGECSDAQNCNAGHPKKPVWNKLSNGAVESASAPAIDAASWPSLSECTKPLPKSSATDSSSGPVSNGPVSQVPANSNPPKKQASSSNPNSNSRHGMSARHRATRRGGTSGGRPSQSSFGHQAQPISSPSPPPPFPVPNLPVVGNYGNFMPVPQNAFPRPVRGFIPPPPPPPPPHLVNNHFSQRNSNHSRRPRGGGHYHNNPGGRRNDHDQSDNYNNNPEVNIQGFNGRDVNIQHYMRGHPRHFMVPPPHGSPGFFTPIPLRPFPRPMEFQEMRPPPVYYGPPYPPHMEHFRGMPSMPYAQPPILSPVSDSISLIKQIDYYFSDENLKRDSYLKSKMDAQGWVPVTIIASFPRVHQITNDTPAILEALKKSVVVEVENGKIRKRNDWMKYITSDDQNEPSSTAFQNLTLDEGPSTQSSGIANEEPNAEESTVASSPSNDEGTN